MIVLHAVPMPPYYRIAISLLLLQRGLVAFQSPPSGPRNGAPVPRRRRPTLPAAASSLGESSAVPSPLESILDDGRGHVNGDLARAIYDWELAHGGQTSSFVKKEFSTRDGLRLVDELAREVLSSLSDDGNYDSDNGSKKPGVSYGDLVQEGTIALLRATSTYGSHRSHADPVSTFEEYARRSIRSSLSGFLARYSRPIRLPLSLGTMLHSADAAADGLRRTLRREPTLAQVAREVGVAPEQLALYRRLHRIMVRRAGTFVSVEDGMEVYDPTLAGVGVGTGLRPRSDTESVGDVRGVVPTKEVPLSTSLPGLSSSTAGEQDLTRLNSQEDDWTRDPPERTVAPLRDAIADTEEINNPLSYTHHHLLSEELDEFLRETLTWEERTVIELRFGLVDSKHGGKGWTAGEIGRRMGMGREEVARVAGGALEKLRRAAAANWDEEDSDAHVEVSL